MDWCLAELCYREWVNQLQSAMESVSMVYDAPLRRLLGAVMKSV